MKIIEILKLLSDPKFQRIVVVGTSCSGKTTFARQLAQALGLTPIELDAIYWKPNWSPRPLEEFWALVEKAIAGESWVVDGNYSKVRDLIWKRATHVIWLNLPFYLVLGRVLRRTVSRIVSQEELFSGNREIFRLMFLKRDSILWWLITTYHRRRREYRALFDQNRGLYRTAHATSSRCVSPCLERQSSIMNHLQTRCPMPLTF